MSEAGGDRNSEGSIVRHSEEFHKGGGKRQGGEWRWGPLDKEQCS